MSEPKIKIEALYKIFGKSPKEAMEHVKNGVGKDELLEKYNHVLGLKDINLNIREKSIQVVMGLSGSGKSTLIRHINRLIEPTSGKITVDSIDVMSYDKGALRNFKNYNLIAVNPKDAADIINKLKIADKFYANNIVKFTKRSFVLKPKSLRYKPVCFRNPKKQDPNVSLADQKIEGPGFTVKI